jgi:GNAT superfamily N-acetyltransferase
VEVRRVDPGDEDALAEWCAVLEASDKELWPDLQGYTLPDIRAFARFRGSGRRFDLLAASQPGGPIFGVGMMELPRRDNRHAAEITVAVHPAQRRRGVGTAIVERMAQLAGADGRHVLNTIVDVPLDRAGDHASVYFAPRVGFEVMLAGNTRHLTVPLETARREDLHARVARAPDAASYRISTFVTPWPDEVLEDHCELLRRMSTDEPTGEADREEEVWDAERIRENDELLVARDTWKLGAVAEHVASGRLVAFTELLLAHDTPDQAWQEATLVHPAHRGHRLGLAVKLANLEFLAEQAPEVRLVVTGNAQPNVPMIAVNDLIGFEIAGAGMFWQKKL